MSQQPSTIAFTLPAWIDDYMQGYRATGDMQEKMDFVVEAARRNIKENSGGPFAAAVFEKESGKLVSLGVNLVESEGLSILHAEMVAFAIAQKKLGTYDLGANGCTEHELVTSTEPCAMCFGAIPWSGVRRVVMGARDEDARNVGFDEGPKMLEWQDALEHRGIEVVRDVLRGKAVSVLLEYVELDGKIYNSRE